MLCQLEIPVETVAEAAAQARFFCLNAAPAQPLPPELLAEVDLLVVNRYELEAIGRHRRPDRADARRRGRRAARGRGGGRPRRAAAGRGRRRHAAGDAFTACLLVSLLEGRAARRGAHAAPARPARSPPRARARSRRCPPRAEVDEILRGMKILLDCDPGHDDAIALLLALASPEVELVGITTVHGNQTLDEDDGQRAEAARVRRPHRRARRRRRRPRRSCREPFVAEYVHGESGMDGPTLPAADHASPSPRHAVDFIADTIRASDEPITLVPTGPLTNIGLFLALHPGRGRAGRADRPDGRRDRRGQRHAGGRVQHLGRPGGGRARVPERPRRDDDRPRRHAPGDLRARADRAS